MFQVPKNQFMSLVDGLPSHPEVEITTGHNHCINYVDPNSFESRSPDLET